MSINHTVLLVGAGHLGSRYLQGLIRAECKLNLIVVDPSSSALETARFRWIEAGGERCHHGISWKNSIPSELENVDLSLVVTPAKGRAELVERIASQMPVRYWVLEKVLAQSVEELETISRLTALSHGAWVNTPRRMMGWHQLLKEEFESKGPIKALYSAGLWGLACNSIHFLDLISWWADEKLDSIDIKSLDPQWFESKRVGNFEVTGRLVARFSKGSTLTLEARDQVDIQAFQIDLADETVWKVDEVNGAAFSTNGDHIDGRIVFQSQLSGRLVDDILLSGKCELPTLRESAALHAIFLQAMLEHWNLSQNRNDDCVPIT